MSHRDSLIKKNKELSKPMDFFNVGFVGAAGSSGSGMTDGFVMGGHVAGTYGDLSSCEEYNGTSWANGGSLSGSRQTGASCGNSSTARYVCGYNASPAPYPNSNRNEEYNGTSWANDTVNPTARNNVLSSGCGVTNNFMICNGHANGSGDRLGQQTWNGSSWSTGNYPSGNIMITTGDSNNALAIIGSATQTFNGTTWSAGATTNVSRSYGGAMGNPSEAVAVGGLSPLNGGSNQSTTSLFNGTSWSAGNNLVKPHQQSSTANTVDNSVGGIFGGHDGDVPNTPYTFCEESLSGVWTSMATLTTARSQNGAGGISA